MNIDHQESLEAALGRVAHAHHLCEIELREVKAERDRLLKTHVPKSWLEDEQRDHRKTKDDNTRLHDALNDARQFANSVRAHVAGYESDATGLIARIDAALAGEEGTVRDSKVVDRYDWELHDGPPPPPKPKIDKPPGTENRGI